MTAVDNSGQAAAPLAETGKRLPFLDGLRGLACLYVVLFHATGFEYPETERRLSPLLAVLKAWLNEGRLAVVFFIVLSGFSLMLPLARNDTTVLRGGLKEFVRRRSRRILPPYYAALVFSLGPILLFNAIGPSMGMGPPIEDALKPGSIISHLFLFHNVKFDWAYRINGPMWSVATEWQIYFVFALALLPLYRVSGWLVTLLVAWFVGCLPHFLLPPDESFYWACPWFLGSFALGMAGAVICFTPRYEGSWLRSKVPWGYLAWVCLAVLVGVVNLPSSAKWPYPAIDVVVSLLAFCWINAGVSHSRSKSGPSIMLRILSSKSMVYLGGFSYSLYLVQHPLFRLAEKIISRLGVNYDAATLIHLLLVVPVIIFMSWVFSEFFERPFTEGGRLLPAVRRWWITRRDPAAT